MQGLTLMESIAVYALPVLFAITLHEVAHGWAAKLLGDPTAAMLGRLSLNPIKHVDPIGTLAIPLILILTQAGFLFGWAKPVPVTWENLAKPRRDMALVAAAGPAANLLMALIWAVIFNIGGGLGSDIGLPILYMGIAGVTFNVMLMVLNLLPLPPLDGGRVLSGLLPPRWSVYLDQIEPYGIIILLALLITGILAKIMLPIMSVVLVLFEAIM